MLSVEVYLIDKDTRGPFYWINVSFLTLCYIVYLYLIIYLFCLFIHIILVNLCL